jgi:adenylosuccinate synthase
MAQGLHILPPACLHKPDTIVFEGAQGVLLDEWVGFPPHNTWSTVTIQHATELATDWGYDVTTIGCIRAYMTRHGAGPLPTESSGKFQHISGLVDPNNPYNDWQGAMRFGAPDVRAWRYALAVAGSRVDRITKLAVSCIDELPSQIAVPIYNDLEVPLAPNKARQERLGHIFGTEKPYDFRWMDRDSYLSYLQEQLRPIAVQGTGPSEQSWFGTVLQGV